MAESYEIIKGFQTKQGLGLYDYDSLHNKPGLATQEKAGLLSPEDKVRIEQIEEIKQAVDEIDYPVDSVNGKTGQVELTKDDIGLDKVENKTSEEIRNEITKENVTGALGFTPLTEDEINEAVQGANNAAQAAQTTADKALQGVATAQNAITETREVAENAHERIDDLGPQVAQGEVITLNDSGEAPLQNLILYGKTTQNGTPTPDSPVELESVGDDGSVAVAVCGKNLLKNTATTQTVNGVTFTVNEDGSVTAHGTANNDATLLIERTTLQKGKYIANGCPFGGNSASGYSLYFGLANAFDMGSGCTFNIDSETQLDYTRLIVRKGATVSNLVFTPMIRFASDADATYEPYKEPQTLTIQPTNGLPGIPVSSGGNYTDENGQQWICDEIDFARGKYIKRIRDIVIDDSFTANNYTSITVMGNVVRCWVYIAKEKGLNAMVAKDVLLCDKLPYNNVYGSDKLGIRGGIDMGYKNSFVLWLPKEAGSTADSIKAYIDANPLRLLVADQVATETDLSAEEIAQYAALHTNYPNTVIYNDEGAEISITYSSPNTALPISGGRMAGPIDMNNNSLIGLAQPQKDNDAATKTYVDKLVKNIDLSNYPTKTELEEMISGFSGFVAQDEPPENIDALWIDTDDESAEEAGSNIELDDSLTVEGMAADAKAVGDAIADVVYSDENDDEISSVPLNADTLGGKLPEDYAPAGFGLGEMNGTSCSDCNTAIQVGFYTMVGSSAINTPSEINAFKWGSLVVDASASAVFQTIKCAYATAYRVGIKSGGVVEWGEWEYENHPMDLGVEYRTTERYNGKVVYAQALTETWTRGTDLKFTDFTVVELIRYSLRVGTMNLPYINGDLANTYTSFANVFRSGYNIEVDMRGGTGNDGKTMYFAAWYTKD